MRVGCFGLPGRCGALLALALPGCTEADTGVDLVTRAEGCAEFDLGELRDSRLVGVVYIGAEEPAPGSSRLQALYDEDAVREWWEMLALGSDLPGWILPDFPLEMAVVIPFGVDDVVETAATTGVVGFYQDGGVADRVVAVYERDGSCDLGQYSSPAIALHAVPTGELESCAFGDPEDC